MLMLVSNYEDEIKIGERKYDELEECYTKNIKITIPGNELEELYRGLQHRYGDCDVLVCTYCNYGEDDD